MDKITEVELRLDRMEPVVDSTFMSCVCFSLRCRGELWPIVETNEPNPKYYHIVCEAHLKELNSEPLFHEGWKIYGR
jgi:hypothetical protein